MLLEPSSSSPVGEDGQDALPDAGKHDRLLGLVCAAFPQLTIERSRVEERGGEHDLLIINERHAFRFPRRGTHDLGLEIAILAALQARSSLPVPFYDFVDPAGGFAGYRFIEGVELTPARFAALAASQQDAVLAAAAQFLSELHRLPPDDVAWQGKWPAVATAADFADHGLAQLIQMGARLPSGFAERVRRFWHSYRRNMPSVLTIIHGDLVSEHLLFDPASARLSGIIDFGDVSLGDPAQDLLGFWAYGEGAALRAVEFYAPGMADERLLMRSRKHFIRYLLDRLLEDLGEGRDTDLVERAARIEPLLVCPEPAHSQP